MADETKRIEAIYGPHAGRFIDVPTADAEAAISDGWARDPYAPVDPDAKPKEIDQAKATEAAHKAARKFSGEDEPAADTVDATKTIKPAEPATYRTRQGKVSEE